MFKMLKHDIKDSYAEVLILNGILIALSLVVFIGLKLSASFLITIGLIAWAIVLMSVFFILMRVIIKSFHTKLFTDCGYLTLTTPVSIDKMLFSKIIVNVLWMLVTLVSVVACVMIVITPLLNAFSESFMIDLLSLIWDTIKNYPYEAFQIAVLGLAQALYSILILLFVLVLANIGGMKKNKMLKGILIYIALAVVITEINTYINVTNTWVSVLISLVYSTIFYIGSRYLITHKLELE